MCKSERPANKQLSPRHSKLAQLAAQQIAQLKAHARPVRSFVSVSEKSGRTAEQGRTWTLLNYCMYVYTFTCSAARQRSRF